MHEAYISEWPCVRVYESMNSVSVITWAGKRAREDCCSYKLNPRKERALNQLFIPFCFDSEYTLTDVPLKMNAGKSRGNRSSIVSPASNCIPIPAQTLHLFHHFFSVLFFLLLLLYFPTDQSSTYQKWPSRTGIVFAVR